jgi:hypothetical protein
MRGRRGQRPSLGRVNPLGGCMPTEGLISGFAFHVQRRNRPDRNSAWPGIGSTDSSADRLPLSGSQRINIRWKAQSLRFPRPKAQEAASGFWTNDHNRALFLVRLLLQPRELFLGTRLGRGRSVPWTAEVAPARALHHTQDDVSRHPVFFVRIRDDDDPTVAQPRDLAKDADVSTVVKVLIGRRW